MSAQYPPQQMAPPPKQPLLPRGCWIALAVFGALTLVLTIGVVIIIYAASQNPEVQRFGRFLGGTFELVREAQNAPGAREVRALGCTQAYVIEAEQFLELARQLDDSVSDTDIPNQGRVVVCQVVRNRQPPTCETVAQTYARAVPGNTEGFTVTVQSNNQQGQSQCSVQYDATGRPIQQGATTTPPLRPNPFEAQAGQ